MVQKQHLKLKLRNFFLSFEGTKKYSEPCYIISSVNTGGFWTRLSPAAGSLILKCFLFLVTVTVFCDICCLLVHPGCSLSTCCLSPQRCAAGIQTEMQTVGGHYLAALKACLSKRLPECLNMFPQNWCKCGVTDEQLTQVTFRNQNNFWSVCW